jgi:predicted ribonuclease YlaK
MRDFFDTCALLELSERDFSNKSFLISNITLKELESIKTSAFKDESTKAKVRKTIRYLTENPDKYKVINYEKRWDKVIADSAILTDNNDSRIIVTAMESAKEEHIIFITYDYCCYNIAKACGLEVRYCVKEYVQDYTGYRIIECRNDEELAFTYDHVFNPDKYESTKRYIKNKYIILKDKDDNIVDKYKWNGKEFVQIMYHNIDSKMFGKLKPKDEFQELAIDSLRTNKITMLRGKPGSGKSLIAINFLFQQLEKHEIEKIIIFCNTVATYGSAKLGFYPGSRTEKLLDSQIGNLLSSKLGSKIEVERLIDEEKLELLPLSDCRGYDTTGLKAGVYISEAQNLDIELMRLALQRIGEDSICIIDGDFHHQVDSPIYSGKNNGMRRVSEVFRGKDFYGEVELKNIYRSRIAETAELL